MSIIKQIILMGFLGIFFFSCKKDELSPLPTFETGVSSLGKLESGSFKANQMDVSNVVVSVSWNAYGKDVKINKIEVYVHYVEKYYDLTKQQDVEVEHFGPQGKTDASLVINNPDQQRVQYPVTITPDKVFNLFKDAKRKYNGPSEVNVFQNPEINRSDPKSRFRVGDRFYATWYLYATDGRIFKSWSPSIQNGELAGANTRVDFKVVP
jgi:hypothetical protein